MLSLNTMLALLRWRSQPVPELVELSEVGSMSTEGMVG